MSHKPHRSLYLFWFTQSAPAVTLPGDMPLESRFGYLFSPSPHAHTAAHELAHGAFSLRHTFGGRYGIPQSTTLNLMDYTATGTQLKKYQWDVLHDAQAQVFKGLQGEEEGRMKITDTLLYTLTFYDKRAIPAISYTIKSGEESFCMFANKNVEIRVEKKNPESGLDFEDVKWLLNGEEVPTKEDDRQTVYFNITPQRFRKGKNTLIIKDKDDKAVSFITLQTYYPPVVTFEEGDNYNGEYMFDKGYEYPGIIARYPSYYQILMLGENAKAHYVPVLGLNLTQEAMIKTKLSEMSPFAIQDTLFQLILRPQEPVVSINTYSTYRMHRMLLNERYISTLVQGKKTPKNPPTLIRAEVVYAGDTVCVGGLEYVSREKAPKEVRLIYTRLKGESDYPKYIHEGFEEYLNTKCMNQLFYTFSVDTDTFTLPCDSSVFVSQKSPIRFMVNNYNYTHHSYEENIDRFFIVNSAARSEDLGSTAKAIHPGFHYLGYPGGILYAIDYEASEKWPLIAHELGHWLRLPHPYEIADSDSEAAFWDFKIVDNKGGTKDNYMDYDVLRKKWLKIQMEYVKQKDENENNQ